jgi:aminoglycoside 2'-N-acetyltransferase I
MPDPDAPTPATFGGGPGIGGATLLHTAQLEPGVLDAAHRLVVEAFGGQFDDEDWDHALGGMHAIVHADGRLVAHGAVVQRRLLHCGRALRAGYVEAVAVHGDLRRRGLASQVMAALEGVIRRGYDAGALSASDNGALLYLSRGWQHWRGTTWALTPEGRVRTADEDDALFVLPGDGAGAVALDLTGEITCDWRDGDLW